MPTPIPTTTTTTTTLGEEIRCLVWGDPHVVTFDLMSTIRRSFWDERHRNWDHRGHWGLGRHIVPDIFRSGDYWVVKSMRVLIQGRYGAAGGWALHGLAFGGAFLENHRLAVDRLWDGKATVTWNGRVVSSQFRNRLARVSLSRDSQGQFLKGTVDLPEGVSVTLERATWNNGRSASVTAYITMRKQSGFMDGHCGPADGNLADDTKEHLLRHWGQQIPRRERLFSGSPPSLLGTGSSAGNEYSPAEVCANSPPLPEDDQLCRAKLNASGTALSEALLQGCLIDLCVGGPGAIEVVSAAAKQATAALEAAGPPPALPPARSPDGWYDGGAQKSCDEGCRAVGLVCTEDQLRAHNADVDAPEKVRGLIGQVEGKTWARACDQTWGSADDVPNWWLGGCHASEASRRASTFDCAARPRGTLLPKHRLCYCHAPTPSMEVDG